MDSQVALKIGLLAVATAFALALAVAWHIARTLRAIHRDVLHAAIDLHQVMVEQLAHQKALLLQGARPEAASGASEQPMSPVDASEWLARLTRRR